MSSKRLVILILFVLCHPLIGGATAAEKLTLRLATGSKTGVYYPIGCGIKAVIEAAYPDDVEIEVVETTGTLENLNLIDKEQVELALVQNDTAYYFSSGQAMFTLPSNSALAIASLYTEYIQIIATKKSGIEHLDQLKGRRIRTGSPPDNVSNSATIIFSLDGWHASDLTDIRCKFSEARSLMLSNSLDAAVVTAGIPTPLLTEAVDGIALKDVVNIIPIEEGLANRLIRAFPYFVYTEIPGKTYDNPRPIKTVGVRAILVARQNIEHTKIRGRNTPPEFIKTVTRLIFEKEECIRTGHGVEGVDLGQHRLELNEGLNGILDHRLRPIIPIHPEAKAFFLEKGLLKRSFSDYASALVWGGVFLILLFYAVKYRSLIRRVAQEHVHLRLIIIFTCLYAIGTLAMYFCERHNNKCFESVGESFWSIIIYVLSGFEDRYPVTWPGRIVSVLILVLSVVLLGAVAGRFAAAFLKREEMRMPKDVTNHIVICNWNERGKRVVSELRHPEGRPDADIVIVDNNLLNEKQRKNVPELSKVYFIDSDPIRHGTLKKARVSLADTVIILADANSPDPDAKSAMIILALLSECKARRPHIITEVVNVDNSQHLKDAGADETICTTEIGVGILAHCAINKQLSVVYKDLLTYSFEGNEIYIITRDSYPDAFIGKTFAQCAQMLYQNRDDKNPVVLMGIRRHDQIMLNPRPGKGGLDGECIIQEDDALIAMAFTAPNLNVTFGA
ncbi:MAG: TAXI family TRAP transporter solute-binding subunit [Phycisphaerae bacterium]|nr:TAXI family TRAP transporter solute-binding subunit [Phycisphaerae bacterium]